MSLIRNVNVIAQDGFSVDAFGRWRISSPETLFDSKNIYDGGITSAENQPLFYDNQQTAGSGTSTTWVSSASCQILNVSDSTAGTRVRQSKMRFNYQPGKSQEIIMSFNPNGAVSNITKREGLFDGNDGLFLELSGTEPYLVQRFNGIDTKVSQANWNLDTMDGSGDSNITLDWTQTTLLFIDYEWLGVGRVRMGFFVDGKIYYAHEFNNTQNTTEVYMRTPNLPLRSEIVNNGSGVAAQITQICSTVISEGGSQDIGSIRYASTNGTHVDMTTENVIYAILGIRLKTTHLAESIKILNAAIQVHTASDKLEWMLILNPTVAGTFNYVDETYSGVQIARGATANTVTGGYKITGGFIESGGVQAGAAGSGSEGIDNAIRLGSLIDGTRDTIILCARPIAGSTAVDVEGSLTWRELS